MKNSELQTCVLGSVSTNCYLLKNKNTGELLIVDPADHAQEIFSRIREMQAKPAAILLTHGHYDHILAVEDVKKEYQIPVYACEKEAGTILDPSANLSGYGNRSCSLKIYFLKIFRLLRLRAFPFRCFTHPDTLREAAAII